MNKYTWKRTTEKYPGGKKLRFGWVVLPNSATLSKTYKLNCETYLRLEVKKDVLITRLFSTLFWSKVNSLIQHNLLFLLSESEISRKEKKIIQNFRNMLATVSRSYFQHP